MCLVTLSDKNRQTLLNQPELVWSFVEREKLDIGTHCQNASTANVNACVQEPSSAEKKTGGFLARVFGNNEKPIANNPLNYVQGERQQLQLDKYWHAMHFLLNKLMCESQREPVDFILGGGTMLADKSVGAGPSRVFTSTEIKVLQEAMAKFDGEQLAQLIDLSELDAQGIYPFDIWRSKGDDAHQYCLRYFNDLKRFIDSAANDGMGMLVYM